ncbi:hypothetical protein BJY00DRAFT_313001 [Aspergillus carlsbadensis]|nr:hypothetical protein BJY00DRAFT_313001 [Aspergillus carlsbadensis]
MRPTTLFLALTPILGALAADEVVTLNLPTEIAGSLTAAELLGSSASTTTYLIPCAETVTICQDGLTYIAEPTGLGLVFPMKNGSTYTASCSVDSSASTDSCVARTGTDDTWEDIGTDDLTASAITITATATATPASNSASPTITPALKTFEARATTSSDTDDVSACPVETTDSDDAAMAMRTAAPWAGAVVAGAAKEDIEHQAGGSLVSDGPNECPSDCVSSKIPELVPYEPSLETLSQGSTSIIKRVKPGIVIKSPHFSWWDSETASTSTFVKDIKRSFDVEQQILRILGDHPRIVQFMGTSEHPYGLLFVEATGGNLQDYLDQHYDDIDLALQLKWRSQAADAI